MTLVPAYTRTCKRGWETLATLKIQNVKSLPEVLTIPQVHQIVDACTTQRVAVYFWTVYSMGLRLEEGLNLQTGDIVEVPVRFEQANDYYGFQFGLRFDPTMIELLEVMPEVGDWINFGVFPGRVNTSWSRAAPLLFLPDAPIFRLRIKALAALQLADVFSLTTGLLHASLQARPP